MKRGILVGILVVILIISFVFINYKITGNVIKKLNLRGWFFGCNSNLNCTNNQFCEFPAGECRGKGRCVRISEKCIAQFKPVCGCNDVTYNNDCTRRRAGVSKAYDGECEEEAYFKFTDYSEKDMFIFKLTNPGKIQEARDILAGRETGKIHIMGIIIKEPVAYNPNWSYYLNSSTIEFFENAIEVCDAGIRYVEEHLKEACGSFLPDCQWCPWSSRLVEEVYF